MKSESSTLIERMAELDKLLSNDLRIEIILIIYMNREMSLNEITKFSGKSKSAISRQMKKLVEMNVIDGFEKNEVTPGLQQKYYKIHDSFNQKITHRNEQQLSNKSGQVDEDQFEQYLRYIFVLNKVVPYLAHLNDNFINKMMYKTTKNAKNVLDTIDLGFLFIADSIVDDFAKATFDYVENVKKIMAGHKDEKSTYMCTLMVQPLAKLLQQNK